MRVLVSGANGFLGARTVQTALDAGYEVVALIRPTSSVARLAPRHPSLSMVTAGNGRGALARAIATVGSIDAVIHAAAIYGRRGEPSSELVASNVVFGLELLEATASRVRAFVSVGTVLPPDVSAYARSKMEFSQWASRAADEHGWPFTELAVELMYGPGDDAGKLVAKLVLACLRGERTIPMTTATQERDFVYVDDVADALLAACRAGVEDPRKRRLCVRIGSGQATTVRKVAEMIRDRIGSPTVLDFGALPMRAHEVMHSVADDTGPTALDWRASVSLEEGIERTIAWYQQLALETHT